MQKDNVTYVVAIQSVPNITITSAIEHVVTIELETNIFNITDLVMRDPPTKI